MVYQASRSWNVSSMSRTFSFKEERTEMDWFLSLHFHKWFGLNQSSATPLKKKKARQKLHMTWIRECHYPTRVIYQNVDAADLPLTGMCVIWRAALGPVGSTSNFTQPASALRSQPSAAPLGAGISRWNRRLFGVSVASLPVSSARCSCRTYLHSLSVLLTGVKQQTKRFCSFLWQETGQRPGDPHSYLMLHVG